MNFKKSDIAGSFLLPINLYATIIYCISKKAKAFFYLHIFLEEIFFCSFLSVASPHLFNTAFATYDNFQYWKYNDLVMQLEISRKSISKTKRRVHSL